MQCILVDGQVLMLIDFDLLFRANDDGSYCPTAIVQLDGTTLRGNDCLSPGQKIATQDIKDLVDRKLLVSIHPSGAIEVHRIH